MVKREKRIDGKFTKLAKEKNLEGMEKKNEKKIFARAYTEKLIGFDKSPCLDMVK